MLLKLIHKEEEHILVPDITLLCKAGNGKQLAHLVDQSKSYTSGTHFHFQRKYNCNSYNSKDHKGDPDIRWCFYKMDKDKWASDKVWILDTQLKYWRKGNSIALDLVLQQQHLRSRTPVQQQLW